MADSSIKLSKAADNEIEKLKYEARLEHNAKVYKNEILEFAVKQIRTCPTCHEKYLKWVKAKGQK